MIGVWGNHDLGLCTDPSEEMLLKYGARVVSVMGRLDLDWRWKAACSRMASRC